MTYIYLKVVNDFLRMTFDERVPLFFYNLERRANAMHGVHVLEVVHAAGVAPSIVLCFLLHT